MTMSTLGAVPNQHRRPSSEPGLDRARVDLYWIPLGAGDRTHLVAASGWVYARLVGVRSGGNARRLFHSALVVSVGGSTYSIEMAPVWAGPSTDRGVTGSGAVGLSWLGRWPLFRYEVRRWPHGCIPDLAEAVGGPQQLSADDEKARLLLDLVPAFPCLVWGRDQLRTGDMWNSNSLTSWLLARSGHELADVHPPDGGRAPGWEAGIVAAGLHAASGSARAPSRVGWREVLRTLAAVPDFVAAPVHRRRHLRWGATDEEVRAAMPCDELVAHPHFTATRAITIEAPPERVWPWLVQVGRGRAGFYSYDLLDALGHRSARCVLPQWQRTRLGDVAAPMSKRPTDATSFRVAEVDPPSSLVWAKPDSTWSWQLSPLPHGRTRLVTRLKQHYALRPATLLTVPLLEIGDFPMMRRMLLGLKERCEADDAD